MTMFSHSVVYIQCMENSISNLIVDIPTATPMTFLLQKSFLHPGMPVRNQVYMPYFTFGNIATFCV